LRHLVSGWCTIVDRFKLHRHVVRLDGDPYTVIALRPGTDARFSTNRFHETWHILTDLHGARLLGRLLCGLAFQRTPGTLVPTDLTRLSIAAARELRRRVPLTGPTGTIRWHTPGLAFALAADRAGRTRPPGVDRSPVIRRRRPGHRVDRLGGLVMVAADAPALRAWAVEVHELGERANRGMDYTELGWPDGEVQVFTDYRCRVSAARVARRDVLATLDRPPAQGDLSPLIWERGAMVRRRRRFPPRRGGRLSA